jgi:hypothetical protein
VSKLDITADQDAEITSLAERYLWWGPVDPSGFTVDRKIAQVMHRGMYEDILRLEKLLGEDALAEVMKRSAPGWFDDRTWDFWRGRLRAFADRDIPAERPGRSFAHPTVFQSLL